MTARPRARRTQRERRETTIAKLVDATILSLQEVGYARTSLQQICKRAGVSHGGVFRHFATLAELVVAAADEVARRQIASFEQRFDKIGPAATPFDALRLVRASCRAPMNAVWYELVVAARTDPTLKAGLAPALERYADEIRRVSRTLPGSRGLPPETVEAAVLLALHVFDGEALIAAVLPSRTRDDLVMAMMTAAVASVMASATSRRPRAA